MKKKETALMEAHGLAWELPGGKVLFEDVDFELHAGELLLISGPNGSGKSTLARILMRRLAAKRGLVRCTVSPKKIESIPQLQNMEFHLPLTLKDAIEIARNRTVPSGEILEIGLLSEMQLERAWNTASGGERQRTLLTSALLAKPELLILDEPLNHLDQLSQTKILQTLGAYLREAKRRGVILVSHGVEQEISDLKIPVCEVRLGDAS